MQLNNFQAVSPPAIQTPLPESDTAHPRKSAYACMSDLREEFSAAGLETDQVWEFIKAQYCVESRALFTGKQWAMIACQLQSARREPAMFKVFVADIPCEYFRIHVFSDDPSVPIGRPRDLRKHHLASEWGDFQEIANENQCTLTVTQAQRTTYYDAKPTTEVPAPVSTVGSPKMPSGLHQNDRFLIGIKATLKVSGKWEAAPAVFQGYYNKYNHANVRDIEIGLEILANANEIESKVTDGGKQYFLPTSDFETLLDRCQVSRYHLAEITGIDEDVMCGYCKGVKISAADARIIGDKLNIERPELEGMVEVRTAQKTAIALKTNARGQVLNVFGDVMVVSA